MIQLDSFADSSGRPNHPCMKISVIFAAVISAVALSVPAHADDLVSEYGQWICDAQRQPDVSIGIPPPRTAKKMVMRQPN
jgi:hypothetical protein